MQFQDFGLAEPIMKALAAKNYQTPTPIQQQAIPPLLSGHDLCGIAQTGTGKTAAFALPSLDHFSRNPKARPLHSCRMLVLSPTRELAAQIADSFRTYARFMRLSVETVFGGVPIGKQIRKLQAGVDILVATPGRLLDIIDQRAFHLNGVEIFVLDEADQMMDMGFIAPLKRIVKMLPQQRQNLFFSATMPREIAELGKQFLHDPITVSVAPQATTAERIRQIVTFVNQSEKQALLTHVLRAEEIDRALIFTRTKYGADKVVRALAGAGIEAMAIHGNKTQAQRTAALQAFRHGHIRLLVATDIAARGIDVSGVSHVINFELPNVPEQYVHRIGRTARAGAEGIAISFVSDEERAFLRAIERTTRVKCETAPLPGDFAELVRKLPKPVAPAPKARPSKADMARSGAGARPPRREGGRADGETARPGRRPRRGKNVGAHKGAVRKFGG
ncbi:MAG: DEAD/DEAH box helicase [Sphingobium sp.]